MSRVIVVRDGLPLPARTVPDAVSQLTWRVLGPLKGRSRSVLEWESGTNRGRLRGQVLLIGCVREAGVPASVVVGEGVVEDAGADLQ